jgi:hypothetical protein
MARRDLRVERNSAVLVFPLLTLVPLPLDFVRPQPLENQSRQPDIHLLAPAQEPSLKIEFVSAASPERELQELNLLCWQPSGPFDSKHEDHFRTD